MFGYSPEELIGCSVDNFISKEDEADHRKRAEQREPGVSATYEYRFFHKDGHILWTNVSISPIFDDSKCLVGSLAMLTDITERKRAEIALGKQLSISSALFNQAIANLALINLDYQYVQVNEAFAASYGKKPVHFVGRSIFEFSNNDEESKGAKSFIDKVVRTKKAVNCSDLQYVYPDTPEHRITWWNSTFQPILDECGKVEFVFILAVDVTEQKRFEVEQQRLNRELQAVRSCEQALLQAEDEQTLLDDICHIIVNKTGYRLAWVGYVEHDEAKTIRPVAWAGSGKDYIENAKISWSEDEERGRGPSGTAARSGKTVYVKDFLNDPLMLPWRESAVSHGFRSSIALPLKDDNKQVFGVFQIYAGEMDAMSQEEIQLIEELANDLAFGIVMLRGRAERKKVEKALRVSEERYRKAEAMGHVGNWEYNLQTAGYWCSDETKRIFGLDPEQPFFTIKDIARCISEKEQVRRAFTDLVEEGKPYNVKFTIIPINSSKPRIITSVGELHRDEYGNPLKVVGIIQDITDLKKTEIELLSHLHFLTNMDRINKAIRTSRNLDEILGNVLDEVLSIFDCDRAYAAYPCDPDSPVWSVPMERTKPEYPGAFSQRIEVEMDKNVVDTFKILLQSGGPVRFGPKSEFPLPVGIEEIFDVKSLMAMAIYPKVGKPWQFGLHQCSYPRAWKQDEVKLLNEIGMRIVDSLAILQIHSNLATGALSNATID
jgi:PAS domain S-box-containing protein